MDKENKTPNAEFRMPKTAKAVLISGLLLALLAVVSYSSMDEPSTYYIEEGALSVTVSGDRAYIATGSNGLVVVDVSDPSNPTHAWNYNGTSVDEVVLYDNSIYAHSTFLTELSMDGRVLKESDNFPATDFKMSDDYMYVITSNRLSILDAGFDYDGDFDFHDDVSNIPSEGGYGGALRKIAVSGDYAYVATNSNYYNIDGEYLTYSGGLLIIDVSNPTNPYLKVKYEYNTTDTDQKYGLNDVYDVVISGNHAYLAHGKDGLVMVDIRNPSNPTYAGRYSTSSLTSNVAVSDGLFPFQKRYVLATTEDDGLIIVDASDPTDPTYVGGYGGYSTAGNPIDVAESGGTLPFQKRYAYILTDSGDSGEPDTLVIYELPSSWWGTPFIILLLTGIIVGVITAVSYRAHHRNAQPDTSMSMTGTKTKAKTAVYSDYIDNRDTIVKDSVLNRPNVNTGGDDKSEKLWEIKALLDKGIINDDEFKQMKKEILGK